MSTVNTPALVTSVLDQVQGEDFKRQLTEDLGTAMTHRASRIGSQKSQRVSANPDKEDRRYIRSMCTSSRHSFPRL